MRSWFAFLLLMFTLPSAAREPRATVEAVAAAIEANYFDEARARVIASGLRAAGADGDFDALIEPLDLATALSEHLRPQDRHFHVRWSEPVPARADTSARRSPPAASNHGIRKVELLPGNIGYLDLGFFARFDFDDRQAAPRLAIDAALQLLAWSDAVLIDLRNNGGGSPAMVGYLASAFTPKGADIYNTFHSRAGTTSEAPRDWHPAPRLEVPLYILVSARTGSAAEALAYTLKHAGRAVIVGEATAGAANPGGPVDVGAGFSVFVSDGSPVNPITRRNWEGDGVAPDIPVAAEEALRIAQIDALERLLAGSTSEDGRVPARWALDALRAHGLDAPRDLAVLAGSYGEIRIEVAEGHLSLRQGRRPARHLAPLPGGEFFFVDEPHRRVAFERGADGIPLALELRFADGGKSRFRRAPGSTP
jgi:hypothetical protein